MANAYREARIMSDERRRFFVDAKVLGDSSVKLTGDLAHRLARVLRLHRDDEVLLTAGGAMEYRVRLQTVSPSGITGIVVGEHPTPKEATVSVNVYLSLLRPNRFDFALEKCTEIGVTRFVPVINARSQLHDEAKAARADRWRRVVVEAAEQCGRGHLPTVDAPMPFNKAISSAPGLKVVPWEEEREQRLGPYIRKLKERPGEVSIFIGPEGGYTSEEVALVNAYDAVLVTLGRRVMRAETAATVASAIVLHELDG